MILNDWIFECHVGPCSSIPALKATVKCQRNSADSTARKSSLWAQQHVRRYPLAKLFDHVQHISKFAKMTSLPREFEPNSSPLQQGAICRSLGMSVLMTQSWPGELHLYLNPPKIKSSFLGNLCFWRLFGVSRFYFNSHLKPLTNNILHCSWEIVRLPNEIDSARTLQLSKRNWKSWKQELESAKKPWPNLICIPTCECWADMRLRWNNLYRKEHQKQAIWATWCNKDNKVSWSFCCTTINRLYSV